MQVISNDIGWGKSINGTLAKHNLPTDLLSIKQLTRNEWNRKSNRKKQQKTTSRRIAQDGTWCTKRKTKTAPIVDYIEHSNYERKPSPEIMLCSKLETKAIITARYGMLECGNNFKGTQSEICQECDVLDDETHRLSYCTFYRDLNNCDYATKIDYQSIYSSN